MSIQFFREICLEIHSPAIWRFQIWKSGDGEMEDWEGGRGSRRIEVGIEDRERGRARAWEVVGGNGG